jgi:hypothetical protein
MRNRTQVQIRHKLVFCDIDVDSQATIGFGLSIENVGTDLLLVSNSWLATFVS